MSSKASDLAVARRSLSDDAIVPAFRNKIGPDSLGITLARQAERQPLMLPLADFPRPQTSYYTTFL
jgi:hypothetical protein